MGIFVCGTYIADCALSCYTLTQRPREAKGGRKKNGQKRMTTKYAFKQSLPIMAGYLVLGMGFGVLLETKGYGVWWAIAMSVLIYAGSMQYVAIDLITGGASVIATALMTLMVNARHLFYGISMLDKYQDTGKYKPYLIFSLTDETYSLVCSGEIPKEVDRNKYYFLVSLFDQCYWVIGSIAGSLIGSILNFNTSGIESCDDTDPFSSFCGFWRK